MGVDPLCLPERALPKSTASLWRTRGAALAAVVLVVAACSTGQVESSSSSSTQPESPAVTSSPSPGGLLDELPASARESTGGGGPRTTPYWKVWNRCAPNNRSAEAESNGGRQAGWVLLDDFVSDPGVSVGDTIILTCNQGLDLLEGRDASGTDRSDDPAYVLAAQVLTAELNLLAGAESCPAIEEVVVAGHILLSSIEFTGSGKYADRTTPRTVPLIEQTIELLTVYSAGELCR